MITEELRQELSSLLLRGGISDQAKRDFATGKILFAIHDELELIRKALTTPVVTKEKPSTTKEKG